MEPSEDCRRFPCSRRARRAPIHPFAHSLCYNRRFPSYGGDRGNAESFRRRARPSGRGFFLPSRCSRAPTARRGMAWAAPRLGRAATARRACCGVAERSCRPRRRPDLRPLSANPPARPAPRRRAVLARRADPAAFVSRADHSARAGRRDGHAASAAGGLHEGRGARHFPRGGPASTIPPPSWPLRLPRPRGRCFAGAPGKVRETQVQSRVPARRGANVRGAPGPEGRGVWSTTWPPAPRPGVRAAPG
jgi:hypothetical protein